MHSPVIAELASLAHASATAHIVGYCLSCWLDGDESHRERPANAGAFTWRTRWQLALSYSLYGDTLAKHMLSTNLLAHSRAQPTNPT